MGWSALDFDDMMSNILFATLSRCDKLLLRAQLLLSSAVSVDMLDGPSDTLALFSAIACDECPVFETVMDGGGLDFDAFVGAT
jgi:hypothetical protein